MIQSRCGDVSMSLIKLYVWGDLLRVDSGACRRPGRVKAPVAGRPSRGIFRCLCSMMCLSVSSLGVSVLVQFPAEVVSKQNKSMIVRIVKCKPLEGSSKKDVAWKKRCRKLGHECGDVGALSRKGSSKWTWYGKAGD